jgi:hypothetical protein
MAVDTPSADHNEYKPQRSLTQSLRGGTSAMRAAGKALLPQEPLENPTAYMNRLARSVLTNFYSKASDKFSGKVTRKDPELLEKTPQQIKDIENNIDNQGNSLAQFTEQSLTCAIDDGVVFWFIDSPTAPATVTGDEEGNFPRTRAQDEALGLRPYVRVVKADNLLGWKHEMVNGKPVLTQIRIAETVTMQDPDDIFNEVKVAQVRVVEPNLQTLWQLRKDEEGKETWQIVQVIATEFATIPLVALYTNQKGFLIAEPLFLDLAHLNTAHWQSESDQTNIVHAIRMPILFATGLSQAGEQVQIDVGPNSIVSGEPGSDLKFVEHTGKSAEVGFLQIERLEQNITTMGADIILNRRSGNPTATQRTLDQAEADSEMAAVSTNVEDAWKEAFGHLMTAFGIGQPADDDMDAIGVNMNKDFNLGMWDVSAIKDLLAMRVSGDLSQSTLWFEMKRIGILSEDFDEEAEEALLELEKEASMEREAQMMREMEQIGADPFGEGNTDDDDDGDDG